MRRSNAEEHLTDLQRSCLERLGRVRSVSMDTASSNAGIRRGEPSANAMSLDRLRRLGLIEKAYRSGYAVYWLTAKGLEQLQAGAADA